MSSPASFRLPLLSLTIALSLTPAAHVLAQQLTVKDQVELMESMKAEGKTGLARKTKEVDARPAHAGEVVITIIKGQGVETKSKPAEEGDWVVRNRCAETGNEEILVKAAKFPERYGEALAPADNRGYQPFRPTGAEMNYFIVSKSLGEFVFDAPWGERMVAMPGDAIVQVQNDPSDTYRIAAASFACTYEITTPAPKP
jgi:hypothetical protein